MIYHTIWISTRYKHVRNFFEVGCLHEHYVIALYHLDRNEKLLEFLIILVTTVHFTDQKLFFVFFVKGFAISFSWKLSKMTHKIICISMQTQYLVKFLFSSYWPKCSWWIRLLDSFNCSIARKKWGIKLIFFLLINIKVHTIVFGRHGQACPNFPK